MTESGWWKRLYRWRQAKHFCRKHVCNGRGGFSTFQTFDFWEIAMMPRTGLVGRLFSGARTSGARKFGRRNKGLRIALGVVATVAMVGLSGCYWGYGNYY